MALADEQGDFLKQVKRVDGRCKSIEARKGDTC